MHILITGAAGALGARLARSIVADPPPGLMRLTLADREPPAVPGGAAVPIVAAALDLADSSAAERRIARRPDLIFHVPVPEGPVPGGADRDWAAFAAARGLFDAIAATPDYAPRVILASSVAVFGPPAPPVIPDDHAPAPATGFSAQLAAMELLLADRVRAGELEGLALRLPAVVGLGAPWGFADWIARLMRDPPAGREAALPVAPDRRLWLASRRAAAFHLRQAAGLGFDGLDFAALDFAALGPPRRLILPGTPARAGEIVEALARVAGADVAARVRHAPEAEAEAAAATWPGWFEAAQARNLGFRPERTLDALAEAELAEFSGAAGDPG